MPRAILLPIILVAGITAAAAGIWTYDLHVNAQLSSDDASAITGSIVEQQ